jgi:hypothetical protein
LERKKERNRKGCKKFSAKRKKVKERKEEKKGK